MKSFIRVFFAAFLGACVAVALTSQLSTEKANKSYELLTKARQLDLLNHMVPLVMTKEQINKMLVVVEKARANVEKIKLMEANELIQYETKINDAISKGVNKDQVPAKNLMVEINRLFNAFSVRRTVAAGENADLVYEVLKKEFNAGQFKAAANSIDMKAYEKDIDVTKLTDEAKVKFFIKDIFLDPACYDLLLKMTKTSG